MITFEDIFTCLERHGSDDDRLDTLHRGKRSWPIRMLPAVALCPNHIADIFKRCSVEFIENGKEFHVLLAVPVLLLSRGKKINFSIGT